MISTASASANASSSNNSAAAAVFSALLWAPRRLWRLASSASGVGTALSLNGVRLRVRRDWVSRFR